MDIRALVLVTILAVVCRVQASFERIAGGTNAYNGEFPYMAALIETPIPRPKCGATIVNALTVITAAHCFGSSADASKYVVYYGRPEYNAPKSGFANITRVSRIVIHPNYNSTTQDYDVAVVKVLIPIFSTVRCGPRPCVGPVRLADANSNPCPIGTVGVIAGWGKTSFGGPVSTALKKAQVTVASCQSYVNDGTTITDRMLCAGPPTGDACQYDSGGPLVTYINNQAVQCGIISFGKGCASGYPSVYTAVSKVRTFIDRNSLLP